MEVTKQQEEAYKEIVKLMSENNLEFIVGQTYQITIAPKKVAPQTTQQAVQQVPKEEVKIVDIK